MHWTLKSRQELKLRQELLMAPWLDITSTHVHARSSTAWRARQGCLAQLAVSPGLLVFHNGCDGCWWVPSCWAACRLTLLAQRSITK